MRRRGDGVWSAARIAYLRAHYGIDRTASEIAETLGVTRGAVIGKASRLGLKCSDETRLRHYERGQWRRYRGKGAKLLPCERQRTGEVSAKPTEGARKKRTGLVRLPPPSMVAEEPRPLRRCAPPPPCSTEHLGGATLPDLRPRACRFPVAGEGVDTLFCGAPVKPETSWCPHHHARVFLPTRPLDVESFVGFVDMKDRRLRRSK